MLTFPNAKINLGLNITEKRPDGYHNLETIFYPIPVEDALEINPLREGDGKYCLHQAGMEIAGEAENNLVVKAYKLLDGLFDLPPVDIHLFKHIPSGAGLGGGSADAAFMLKMLNEKFGLGLSTGTLEEYAFRIGRSIPDEESAIRSQAGGILFQSPGTQSKAELLIQHFQHKCSICRAATQSGPRWDMLEQMNIHRRQVEQSVQQLIRFHHEVVFRFSRYFHTSLMQAIFAVTLAQRVYFQRIFHGNRVEDGLQVMVTVRSFFCNIQSQVYFSIRKSKHC
jgi:4-diphosphocytidyl-2C-methyl-D-erythritol kinase